MSSYREGQVHQLVEALEAAGFTANHLTKLGQHPKLEDFRFVLDGLAKIKPIKHIIDLSSPCRLPFGGSLTERMSPPKSGVVKLERRADDLYLDGRKINAVLSERQKDGKVIVGYELRMERYALGGNVSAKVLDYLEDHSELWPENWKKDKGNTIYIYFWDDIFRGSSSGILCVRYGYWGDGGRVASYHTWLDGVFGINSPSASLY